MVDDVANAVFAKGMRLQGERGRLANDSPSGNPYLILMKPSVASPSLANVKIVPGSGTDTALLNARDIDNPALGPFDQPEAIRTYAQRAHSLQEWMQAHRSSKIEWDMRSKSWWSRTVSLGQSDLGRDRGGVSRWPSMVELTRSTRRGYISGQIHKVVNAQSAHPRRSFGFYKWISQGPTRLVDIGNTREKDLVHVHNIGSKSEKSKSEKFAPWGFRH
ncbi:hypothetical protein EDB87DRAFT_1575037 [Lactarius vividus]|nr:hypothetical protein EDB87DRAFT_1575037 [Lactarius vividus]